MKFLLITGGQLPLLYFNEDRAVLDGCLSKFQKSLRKPAEIEWLYKHEFKDYDFGRLGKYEIRFGIVSPVIVPVEPMSA